MAIFCFHMDDIRAINQIRSLDPNRIPDPLPDGYVDKHGKRITVALYVCGKCGRTRTSRIDGWWDIDSLDRGMQVVRPKRPVRRGYWLCGCGHENGANLSYCAVCGKPPAQPGYVFPSEKG